MYCHADTFGNLCSILIMEMSKQLNEFSLISQSILKFPLERITIRVDSIQKVLDVFESILAYPGVTDIAVSRMWVVVSLMFSLLKLPLSCDSMHISDIRHQATQE